MSEQEIGQRIKELRKNKKLTLKTLSEITGINQGTLSLLENGENTNTNNNQAFKETISESISVGDTQPIITSLINRIKQ